MKKQCLTILVLILILGCCPVFCVAEETNLTCAEGFYYYLEDFDGTTGAVICRTDTEWDHIPYEGECTEVIIPSTIAGYPVYGVKGAEEYADKVVVSEGIKYIYEGAFASPIDEVMLPSTVEYIEDGAFTEYDSPRLVSISPDNPCYIVKDGMVLTKDMKDLLYCFISNDEMTIPGYVEIIHPNSILVSGVGGGQTIIFSEGIKKIQPFAILSWSGFASFYFPKSIEYIATNAYDDGNNSAWVDEVYFMGDKVPNGAEDFLNTIYFNKVYFDYAERDDLCFGRAEGERFDCHVPSEDLAAFLALIRDGKLDEAADPENYVRISEPEEQPTQTQPPATPQTEDGEMAELQEKSSLAVTLSAVLAIGVIATVVVVKKRK